MELDRDEVMEKVVRFQQMARHWAEMEPERLLSMLLDDASRPCWMLRGGLRESEPMMLIMAPMMEIGDLIAAMLVSAPPAVRELMMQAFIRFAQHMAAEHMARLTPEEQIELRKKGTEIANVMLDKAMDPDATRLQ